MTKEQIMKINSTTLAYLGDAVFEVIVREKIVTEKPGDVGRAHHTAVRYVSAAGQAKAAKAMNDAKSNFLIIYLPFAKIS